MNNVAEKTIFSEHFDAHIDVTQKTLQDLAEPFQKWLDKAIYCLNNNGKILFFGNGGSAADAQHLATELTVRYTVDRPAIAALSLSTDTSALTAISNDFSYDDVFSRQIEALGSKGDMAIGISTSGNSQNIINGMKQAKLQGITTVGLTGKSGGKLPNVSDVLLVVPSDVTAHIQEMHITLGHIFCAEIQRALYKV